VQHPRRAVDSINLVQIFPTLIKSESSLPRSQKSVITTRKLLAPNPHSSWKTDIGRCMSPSLSGGLLPYYIHKKSIDVIRIQLVQDGFHCGTPSWPSFQYLLVETNSFGPGAVLLSCLVSELQEPPSPGLELRTLFSVVLTFLKFLPSL
jgi:hypothetical protein